MSGGIERMCREMANYLNSCGVPARAAWPAEQREEQDGPVTVVSLRGCQMGPAGFQDYLGERYDAESGLWQEQYGRKAELTFGLDLYGREKGAGEEMQAAFDALAGALLLRRPGDLEVRELSCGQIVYDSESRRLKWPAEAKCLAYLCAVTCGDSAFIDFELRGVAKV